MDIINPSLIDNPNLARAGEGTVTSAPSLEPGGAGAGLTNPPLVDPSGAELSNPSLVPGGAGAGLTNPPLQAESGKEEAAPSKARTRKASRKTGASEKKASSKK